MTPHSLNLILFGIVVVVFAIFGFSASRKQSSAKDYFHNENLFKNVVSLTATNITLGTGLVYLVTGAQHNGLLMMLIPIMVWLGYFLLALFLEKVTNVTIRTGKNFLASINEQISKMTVNRTPFSSIVSGSLVITFVLLLAFEIFASSKVISPFLFKSLSVRAEILLSIIIFCITILYTLLGGINAVFKVDILQVPLICLFLPVFIITTVPKFTNPEFILERISSTLKFDGHVLAAIAIASVNAVATQFYSILNWGAVSNVKLSNQQRLLKWVGASTAVILAVFVLAGLLHPVKPGDQVWLDMTNSYSSLASQTNLTAYLFSGILLLGMASILLTTTDAVVITAIMFWYDNVLKRDSKNTQNDLNELKKIRIVGAVIFILCFAILIIINYLQPDPFYLLLSMAGGIAVFAPMIVTTGYLSSRGNALRIFKPVVIYIYFILFLLTGVVNILMLLFGSQMVGYVGVVAFFIALIYSVSLILWSKSNGSRSKSNGANFSK